MSLNDIKLSNETAKSTTIYAGVANPTKSGKTDPLSANFVNDPTIPRVGAGVGIDFDGSKQAARQLNTQSGVIEALPGIIESTNVHPLNENSIQNDGQANAKSSVSGDQDTCKSNIDTGTNFISGITKMTYGHLTRDEETKKTRQDMIYGK